MICRKCLQDFEETNIELSHDIPKYLGGTDADGRHYLCKNCHKEYELEVLKIVLMNFIKNISEDKKKKLRFYASIVKNYYFKDGDTI